MGSVKGKFSTDLWCFLYHSHSLWWSSPCCWERLKKCHLSLHSHGAILFKQIRKFIGWVSGGNAMGTSSKGFSLSSRSSLSWTGMSRNASPVTSASLVTQHLSWLLVAYLWNYSENIFSYIFSHLSFSQTHWLWWVLKNRCAFCVMLRRQLRIYFLTFLCLDDNIFSVFCDGCFWVGLDSFFPFKCRKENLISVLIPKIFWVVLPPGPRCARTLFMALNCFTSFIKLSFGNGWTVLVPFTGSQECAVACLYRPWINMQKKGAQDSILPPKKCEMGRMESFLHINFFFFF